MIFISRRFTEDFVLPTDIWNEKNMLHLEREKHAVGCILRTLHYKNGAVKRYSEDPHESIQARAVSLAARKAAAKPAPKKPAPKKPAPKPAPKKHGKGKGKFKAPGSSSSSSTWICIPSQYTLGTCLPEIGNDGYPCNTQCVNGPCTPMMAAGVAVCS
ncbi:hypothetical protein V2G26_020049 [Clonostachys chloroleuca]